MLATEKRCQLHSSFTTSLNYEVVTKEINEVLEIIMEQAVNKTKNIIVQQKKYMHHLCLDCVWLWTFQKKKKRRQEYQKC